MAFTPATTTKSPRLGVLSTTLKNFHEVSKLLWEHEHDWELRSFYIQLVGYFLLIGDISRRIAQTANDATAKNMAEILVSSINDAELPGSTAEASAKLSTFNQAWSDLPDIPSSKLEFIKETMHFGATTEERIKLIQDLDSWEREAKSRFPDDVRDEASEDVPKLEKLPEPSYGVSTATQSIFIALLGCKTCSCSPVHEFGANLGLGTYRRRHRNDETTLDFDIFLTRAHDLHEARVRTVRKKVVQWAEGPPERPPESTLQAKRKAHRQRIKQLCEPINKMKRAGAHRLELEVEETMLYKLQSGRDASLIDISRGPTSLDHFLRYKKDSFTERTKRILAILLGYAVLYLADTPWLSEDWNSSNVFFFHTITSEIPLRPFVGSRLWLKTQHSDQDAIANSASSLVDDIDPDDLDPDDVVPHASPTVVALAVMLMEVFTATPFEELASRYGLRLTSDLSQIWFDARKVMDECVDEIPFPWSEVVNSALEPHLWESADDDDAPLDTQSLSTRVYEHIIQPLEHDLTQAFPDISLEGLDELAQKVDLNWYGLARQPRSSHTVVALPVHPSRHTIDRISAVHHSDRSHLALKRASTTIDLPHQHQPHCAMTSASPPSSRRYTEPKVADNELRDIEAEIAMDSQPEVGILPSHTKTYEDYTVGIVCAMSFEMSAVRYMLDNEHSRLPTKAGDFNMYILGDLHGHNVVLTCLPGTQGKSAASSVAANMSRTFPCLKWHFLVGIGGGVPSEKNDIRLGDVVVSMPEGSHGGVVQYDLGKDTDTSFLHKGFLWPPPPLLRSAVGMMRSDHSIRDNRIAEYLSDMIRDQPRLAKYQCPSDSDILFQEGYSHATRGSSCADCDKSRVVKRPARLQEHPVIHYGLIASGDRVLKSTMKRSEVVKGLGDVLGFEMEAGGVMSEFPCIVLRGISDYADSHKNDNWHHYAAATAAACTKELLSFIDA